MGEALPASTVRPKLRADVSIRKSGKAGLYELQRRGSRSGCTLHELELKVAQLLDGRRSHQQIIELSKAMGLPLTEALFEKFLRELIAYDMLDVPGTAASSIDQTQLAASSLVGDNLIHTTAPFSMDVISGAWTPPEKPRLRKDLRIRKVEKGRSLLFEVTNPNASATCTLYEIEHTVAQLMNGGRSLVKIVSESAALGLPMTVEQLVKFMRQLSAYGLIENAAPLPPLLSTGFTSAALEERLPRQGPDKKSPTSKGMAPPPTRSRDFESTAITTAQEAESLEIEQVSSSEFYAIESGPTSAGEIRMAPAEKRAPVAETRYAVENVPALSTPMKGPLAPQPLGPGLAIPLLTDPRLIAPAAKGDRKPLGETGPATGTASAPSPAVLSGGKTLRAVGAGVVLVVLAAVVSIRVPVHVTQKCALAPLDRTPIPAPTSGTVAEVLVKQGQAVKVGDVLVRSRKAGAPDVSAKKLEEAKRLEEEIAAGEKGSGGGGNVAALRKEVAESQRDAFAARRVFDNVEKQAKKGKASSKQVQEAKDRLKRARERIQEARDQLSEALAGNGSNRAPSGSLREKKERLADLQTEIEKAQRVAFSEVRSPTEGTVLGPSPDQKLQTNVEAGDELLSLGDPTRLGVQLRVTGEQIEVGAPASFVPAKNQSKTLEAKVTSAAPPAGAPPNTLTIAVTLVDVKGVQPGEQGELAILAGKRSLLNSLLR
ncbi:MAG: HlyD family efflux transporter periplasmic adaptor subunit [Myxococcaceae bacterium]